MHSTLSVWTETLLTHWERVIAGSYSEIVGEMEVVGRHLVNKELSNLG